MRLAFRKGRLRSIALFCLLWSEVAFGQIPVLVGESPLRRSERLSSLRSGDEIVYDFQQSVTVVRVVQSSGTTVTLHVASATNDVAEREGFPSWLAWERGGCRGAASDETITLRIGEQTTVVSEGTKGAEWLITLLGCDSTPVPEPLRRKAGPAPMPGEIDLRSPWQPRVVVDGYAVGGKSDAYSFCWPNDASALSGRTIIAYFPRSPAAVPALPYWIESPSSSARVGVIDSHHEEHS